MKTRLHMYLAFITFSTFSAFASDCTYSAIFNDYDETEIPRRYLKDEAKKLSDLGFTLDESSKNIVIVSHRRKEKLSSKLSVLTLIDAADNLTNGRNIPNANSGFFIDKATYTVTDGAEVKGQFYELSESSVDAHMVGYSGRNKSGFKVISNNCKK